MTNGEKYKTARERTDAFNDFCRMYSDGDEVCYGCPLHDTNYKCQFAWLNLKAEEEKPLPCPFCGGKVEIESHSEGYDVRCSDHYCYVGRTYKSKAEAIAAHNSVAKAVKEADEEK